MPALKLALELASLRMPFKEALHTAAQLGVAAVEIDARGEISSATLSRTGVRQVRKMLEDLNLRVAAVSFRTRRGYATEEDLDPRVTATKAAMDLAHSLGASVVVSSIGRVPAPDSKPWKLLVEILGDLGQYALQAGAMLAAETGTEKGEELAQLLGALREGSMGVDLNPGRLVLNGFSPLDAVSALQRWIVYVHLSDATGSTVLGLSRPASIGRGNVDFPSLLGALDEAGYRGWFTVQAPSSADPVGEVTAALEYLRRL